MGSDSVSRRVARKELRLFFASPAAWLFLASFSAVCLFTFFWVETFFARNIADIRPLFEWMPILLIFLCATLTMHMWSDERRNGTLEHVLTLPADTWRIVLGKFRACLTLLVLALAGTLPLPITVALIAGLDWGPVFAGYTAAILLGCTYLAIGLFLSARTDNAIVSLLGAVTFCGLLYLVGSDSLTAYFDADIADRLRLIGTGARFESITRGVIDVRDLFYYLSLTAAFLMMNVYSLERQRWARSVVASRRHRQWRLGVVALLINLLLANGILARVDNLRLDLTRGQIYTLSDATVELLDNLSEPLLLRGYFSARTHPKLAPLIPQLRDLMREYAVASQGKVRVEFIDPQDDPEQELEANQRYGITATPFQVADRYQSSLVNSYFNLLVSYGDEFQTLGFSDLIEVRTAATRQAQVMLRNPEYDISRAIKNVAQRYQTHGGLFDGIEHPIELIGYVSDDERLPEPLRAYKKSIAGQLQDMVDRSEGKFSFRLIDPDARDGALAGRIAEQWGFKPMLNPQTGTQPFFFYLTLADERQVVQLSTGHFNAEEFTPILTAGIHRFGPDTTKTVALVLPGTNAQLSRFKLGGPTFKLLEQSVAQDYNVLREDLSDGLVSPQADILAVIAPQQLDSNALFAIDQFLMHGGTVVLATSPHSIQLSDGQLALIGRNSGLQAWLAHNGIAIGNALVLDEQNAPFPAPTTRGSGKAQIRDVHMVNYPWFVDIRGPGLAQDHTITAALPQLTMAWPSPLTIEPHSGRQLTRLLQSSPRSWLSDSTDINPTAAAATVDKPADSPQDAGSARSFAGRQLLGAIIQGRFDSYFSKDAQEAKSPPQHRRVPPPQAPHGGMPVLLHSPESARIVLYASNDFMADQVLNAETAGRGTQYHGPLALFMNTLDWALQDEQLVGIRARGHFNRTLPPLSRETRQRLEYLNYGLALLWLMALALGNALLYKLRRRRYRLDLGL